MLSGYRSSSGAYGINELPLDACVTSGFVWRIDESNGQKMADFTVGLLNCTSMSCLIGMTDKPI